MIMDDTVAPSSQGFFTPGTSFFVVPSFRSSLTITVNGPNSGGTTTVTGPGVNLSAGVLQQVQQSYNLSQLPPVTSLTITIPSVPASVVFSWT